MESIDSRSQFSDPSMSQKTNKQKKSKIFFIISLFYRGNEAHTAVCVTYRRYGDMAVIAPSPTPMFLHVREPLRQTRPVIQLKCVRVRACVCALACAKLSIFTA